MFLTYFIDRLDHMDGVNIGGYTLGACCGPIKLSGCVQRMRKVGEEESEEPLHPQAAIARRIGDWDCEACGAECFGSKNFCYRCKGPKPGGRGSECSGSVGGEQNANELLMFVNAHRHLCFNEDGRVCCKITQYLFYQDPISVKRFLPF
jgi:hypothetical protein